MALVFTACDNGTTGGGNSFVNTTWSSNQLDSFYHLSFEPADIWRISIVLQGEPSQVNFGTYSVSGGTATLFSGGFETGRATISGNTLTLTGMLSSFGITWTRQ
jgi:hypothetical protein